MTVETTPARDWLAEAEIISRIIQNLSEADKPLARDTYVHGHQLSGDWVHEMKRVRELYADSLRTRNPA